jgi:peptidoglycan/LPS O-acetylase OafA/YrhL
VYQAASALRQLVGQFTFQIIAAFAFFFVGAFLYRVRCRHLAFYGGLEIAVGLLTAVYLASILNDTPKYDASPNYISNTFAVLAALYVIVRGADNIHKSLTSEAAIVRWNRFFFGKDSMAKL